MNAMHGNVTHAYPGYATAATLEPQSAATNTSKLYVIWIILAVSTVLFLFLSWYDQRIKKRRTTEDEAVKNKNQLILTPKVRRVIFAQAFDINQQTLEIGKSNLRSVDDVDVESGECTVDTEGTEADTTRQDFGTESSVLVFHKEQRRRKDSDATDSTSEDEETESTAEDEEHIVHNSSGQCVTSGICAICLDPYQAGETIVWSQDKECPHVYHKECFLDYVSNKKSTDLKDNPCPICRRNFCSVCLV